MKILVDTLAKKYPFDFVMYIGEDQTNEPVFTYLNGKRQKPGKELQGVSPRFNYEFLQNAGVFTCTIGRKATQAKYFLNDSDSVVRMLEALQSFSAKAKKNKSQNELRGMSSGGGSGIFTQGV